MPVIAEDTPILPCLSSICGRSIVARFDSPHMSSDGGLLVLREVELRLGIAQRLAACISDPPMLAADDLAFREPARCTCLAAHGPAMIDQYCRSFHRVPVRVVLDIDDTFDAVHGGQQLRLFNAHHGQHGFQPIVVFDGKAA